MASANSAPEGAVPIPVHIWLMSGLEIGQGELSGVPVVILHLTAEHCRGEEDTRTYVLPADQFQVLSDGIVEAGRMALARSN